MTKSQERAVERIRAFIERETAQDGQEIKEWSVAPTYGTTIEVLAKIGFKGKDNYIKWKQIFVGSHGHLHAYRESRAPKHLRKRALTRVSGTSALWHTNYSF